MTLKNLNPPVDNRRDMARGLVRRLAQLAALVVLQGVILLLASGQPDWRMAWVYLGSYVALIAVNAAILLPRDRELIAERSRIETNAKRWDKVVMVLLSVFSLGMLTVAGLDRRFGWTPPLGWVIPAIGLLLFLLGFGLVSWAMASNRFFSSVVRIQEDRGHAVADGGPYRHVRHPGYLGMMVSVVGTPLLLGSPWALIGAGLYASTLVVRTVLEDRMLRRELPGYTAYAARVRHRVLPGFW
jgi:protein-S-isoprenylcysteine O-methyltransferase Ste14